MVNGIFEINVCCRILTKNSGIQLVFFLPSAKTCCGTRKHVKGGVFDISGTIFWILPYKKKKKKKKKKNVLRVYSLELHRC